jgi:glycerophosphoryl diester phosphodiesterase
VRRGCLYEELENTRPGFIKTPSPGFIKTPAMGADAIELDVFLLKCGTVVVFHGSGSDENPGLLNRYCVGRGESILNYTYDELQDIVVFNEHYPEFGCRHADKIRSGVIPTLEQVLLDVKETPMIVKIELKGAEPVLTLVELLGMQHRCHYSSFDLRQIGMIRALRSEKNEYDNHVYKTGALFSDVNDDDYLERALEVGASEVHLRYDECTSTRVHEIHAAGMDSMVWFRGPVGMSTDVNQRFWDVGNEDYAMYQVVMQTGVKQMCINRPDVMVKIFDKTKP